MSNAISIETTDRTMIIRFTRPEIRNPLSSDVLSELESLLNCFKLPSSFKEGCPKGGVVTGGEAARPRFFTDAARKAEDTPNQIIFTGTEDVFASGADLKEIGALSAKDAAAFAQRGQALMNRIANLTIPTIAAINGYCFGGALDLALACDVRIASPNAKFCHPGTGLGIITGWGGTQRLPRLIGEANALEMFFTALPITAEEALRIKLIDEITDDPLAACQNR